MNKLNKGKLIGVVAASLSAVSLMGVGFASWVISRGDTKTTGNINVTVGEIEDKRVVFSVDPIVGSDSEVKFDADSKYTGGLIGAGTNSKEDLTFNVTYTVKADNSIQNWSVSAKLIGTNYDKAVADDAKYIVMPTTLSSAGATALTKPTADSTSDDLQVTLNKATEYTTYTVVQKFAFKWGEAFNNTNPCSVKEGEQIWTGKTKETATKEKLLTNLNGLKALNLAAFTVEFTTVVK